MRTYYWLTCRGLVCLSSFISAHSPQVTQFSFQFFRHTKFSPFFHLNEKPFPNSRLDISYSSFRFHLKCHLLNDIQTDSELVLHAPCIFSLQHSLYLAVYVYDYLFHVQQRSSSMRAESLFCVQLHFQTQHSV